MVDHDDIRQRTKADLLTFLGSNKKVDEVTVFGIVKYSFLASTVSNFAYPWFNLCCEIFLE